MTSPHMRDSVGNQITANRIFANSGQAIDLGYDGVTENASAPRQGPNNLQNFPILVTTAGGRSRAGWGAACPTRLFASTSSPERPTARRVRRAQDYLGSMEVTTDATGQVVSPSPSRRRPGCRSSRRRPPTPRATPRKSRPCTGSLATPPSTVRIAPTSLWSSRPRRATESRSKTRMPAA